MFEILAEAAVRDVGIGAAGVTVLGIVAWLAKAGFTGNFRLGGGLSKKETDCNKAETAEADRYSRELCNLRHKQIEDHLLRSDTHAERLEAKMESGFATVHTKLDRVVDHLLNRQPRQVDKEDR